MAELHVQRKRNNYWWLWLLLILLIIGAAIYYYMNYYNKSDNVVSNIVTNVTAADTANYVQQNNAKADTASATSGKAAFWNQVDFNAPDTTYAEVKDKNVIEKANSRYAIYTIRNNILFDNNKSDLSAAGKTGLKQIGASINQRFKDADVKIYSHIDSSIEKGNNNQIAKQRAEGVRSFLVNEGKVNENRISIFSIGGSPSSATNTPASGNIKSNSLDVVVKR